MSQASIFEQTEITKESCSYKFRLKSLKLYESSQRLELEFLYHSLEDLSLCLNLPNELIGFRGQLAFEYSDLIEDLNGMESCGEFSPEDFKIILKSSSGFSSISHEWGHAIEYFFAKLMDFEDDEVFISKTMIKNNQEVSMDIKSLLLQINEYLDDTKGILQDRTERLHFCSEVRKYYLSNSEMFARTFEKYVRIKQFQKGLIKGEIDQLHESEFMPTYIEILPIVPALDSLISEFSKALE